LWIRFFVLAVFATMYVRDHSRPEFHAALGVDPTEYDFTVFRITSEISQQVFPLTLDLDSPKFKAGLEKLRVINQGIEAARAQGGIGGGIRRLGLTLSAATTMARLYLLPARPNALPADIRLAPTW
jgi:magnesium-protoporphyrin IX monomethyl ester (oxidative) cyclase